MMDWVPLIRRGHFILVTSVIATGSTAEDGATRDEIVFNEKVALETTGEILYEALNHLQVPCTRNVLTN